MILFPSSSCALKKRAKSNSWGMDKTWCWNRLKTITKRKWATSRKLRRMLSKVSFLFLFFPLLNIMSLIQFITFNGYSINMLQWAVKEKRTDSSCGSLANIVFGSDAKRTYLVEYTWRFSGRPFTTKRRLYVSCPARFFNDLDHSFVHEETPK